MPLWRNSSVWKTLVTNWNGDGFNRHSRKKIPSQLSFSGSINFVTNFVTKYEGVTNLSQHNRYLSITTIVITPSHTVRHNIFVTPHPSLRSVTRYLSLNFCYTISVTHVPTQTSVTSICHNTSVIGFCHKLFVTDDLSLIPYKVFTN